jgi:hypothetical protein
LQAETAMPWRFDAGRRGDNRAAGPRFEEAAMYIGIGALVFVALIIILLIIVL